MPDEIARVGYDDIDFARSSIVPITSVRQPAVEIGCTAIELMLREAQAGEDAVREQFVFAPKLMVRASTGVVPGMPEHDSGAP